MAITPLPTPPSRSDPNNFAIRADAFMAALPTFVNDVNASAAGMNALAAGGAYAIPYTYRSSSSFVGSSTGGMLAIKTTSVQLDTKSLGAVSVAALLSAMGASTSSIKGLIRIQKSTDVTKWAVYTVTSYTQGGSGFYGDIFGTLVASSNGANPFSDSDPVILFFQRTGDKGDIGATPNFTYIYVRDEKTSGTGGGVASNGANVRVLNTVKVNTITGASLSSNAVTLPAGTYEYVGSAPGYMVNSHQVQLWNVTDGVQIDAGTSEFASVVYNVANRSVVRGVFTISAEKAVMLRHLITNGGAGTFGQPASNGVVEVYAELWIKKVA